MAAGAAGAQAATGIASGIYGAEQARKAGNVQMDAASQAAKLQKEQFQAIRSDLSPYRKTGVKSLGQYTQLLTGEGGKAPDYSLFTDSPGYRFEQQEGKDILEQGAAARGGLLSGAAAKALQRFGQGVASKQYGTFLDRLQGLSAAGQNAAVQTGTAGQQYATAAGQNLQDLGAAQASKYAGAAEAYGGMAQNLTGAAGTYGASQGQTPSALAR